MLTCYYQHEKRLKTRVDKDLKTFKFRFLIVKNFYHFDCVSAKYVLKIPFTKCVIIIYNPRKNKQTHILNASRKTITALAISLDGRHIVTGECGHQPHVRVWDIHERVQVAEFSGHKFGINCVAFSPNLKYVVSVGSQHDMIVNVWDWRNNIKVASNKVSSKVKAVSFSEDGGHFVTVGNRHVKFWYLEYCRSTKYKEPVPLMGRSAILGEQRNNYFCDVACGRGDVADSTFAITKSGLLCEFNSRRLLDKWVELRANAHCLSVGLKYVFIGCSDGIVRCFSPYTLEYLTTLPRTHFLGADIAKSLTIAHMGSHPAGAKYPDTVAITLDEVNRKVTCIYNDHSMYVWDIKDIRKVGKSHSFLYHSATIWGVEMFPEDSPEYLPPGSFVTCSSDDTIRIWNLDTNTTLTSNFKRNEILKLLYIDESLAHICENDRTLTNNDKGETSFDGRNGVRCIQIAPDGLHLASGDRSGNIRIYDLQYMQLVLKIEAHDAEVLCLEYSKPQQNRRYLASASRDRLIHIFDVNQGYSFIQTLDDHSSSITAVRFVQQFDNFQMISCGADRSIIFRSAQFTPNLQFTRSHHIVVKTTPYDMDIDSNSKQIFTACQDRNVRVYNINTGKHSRTFKGSQSDDGTLIKVVLDNSRLYVATSSTDKNLSIYDNYSGDCVATMFGHSEVVTGLRFTNDGKQLISVSGDGCIFVWRLPPEMTHSIQVHKSQMKNMGKAKQGIVSARRSVFESPRPLNPAREFNFDDHNGGNDEEDLSYRFSVGPLPLWAKKQIAEDPALNVGKGSNVSQPKGRWAQRIDPHGINVKTVYTSGEIISFPRYADNESQQNDFYDVEHFGYEESETSAEFEHSTEIFSRARSENMRSQSPLGMVTVKRGSGEATPFRSHHPTDSSSLRIDDFDLEQDEVVDDEIESTEQDLQEVIYYPPLDDDSHSLNGDFKVCNTNPDDLREAHRRNRKLRAERPTDIPILQIAGTVRSTDSEEDEEATTPLSIDQNVLSMFSMSTESLDRVGQREKFMKINFENLEGSLQDGENNDNRSSITARYLSKSQHPPRKTSTSKKVGKEVLPSPKRLETMKRMEETRKKLDTIGWKASLNNSKSISDLTRILPEKDNSRSSAANKGMALLKTAATNSMPDLSGTGNESKPSTVLNQDDDDNPSSFCTNSLPRRTEKRNVAFSGGGKRPTSPCRKNVMSNVKERTFKQPLAKKVGINQVLPSNLHAPVFVPDVSETIRRASSMTDLSPSKSFRRLLPPRPNVPNRTPAFGGPLRRNSAFVDPSKVSRCSSMTTLVGVGDEDSRILRPTISSKNKMKANEHGLPKSASSSSLATRKNLENADSGTSSGDISPVDGAMDPPSSLRARSTSVDRGRVRSSRPTTRQNDRTSLSTGKWKSERDLSSKMTFSLPNSNATKTSKHEVQLKKPTTTAAVVTRKAIVAPTKPSPTAEDLNMDNPLKKSPQELPVKDDRSLTTDILKLPLTHELCESTAGDLKLVSDNTLQLFKRVSMDNDLPEPERQLMLNALSQAVNQAQDTLRLVRSTSSSEHPDLVQVTGGKKIVAPELPGGGEAMSSLLQQYSDMLLNIVQQGMNSQSQTGSDVLTFQSFLSLIVISKAYHLFRSDNQDCNCLDNDPGNADEPRKTVAWLLVADNAGTPALENSVEEGSTGCTGGGNKALATCNGGVLGGDSGLIAAPMRPGAYNANILTLLPLDLDQIQDIDLESIEFEPF
uniref:MABP1/WDR62 second WD40 domain-containing protein n=1 Tax=Strigamia maritima TaxID=126957 RepID=T1IQM5_STRMM